MNKSLNNQLRRHLVMQQNERAKHETKPGKRDGRRRFSDAIVYHINAGF